MTDKYKPGDRVLDKFGNTVLIVKGTSPLWRELMKSARYDVKFDRGTGKELVFHLDENNVVGKA